MKVLRGDFAPDLKEIIQQMHRNLKKPETRNKPIMLIATTISILLLLILPLWIHESYKNPTSHPPLSKRERIIQIAIGEIGKGETFKNNSGSEVLKYTRGVEEPWCAAFVSWVINAAGVHDFGYDYVARSIYNTAKTKNLITRFFIQPGYLIVFNKKDSWHGHIGIVEKIDNGWIYTIEGNVGKFPSKVQRRSYQVKKIPNLLGFIRIP